MANFYAIEATGQAILSLLESAYKRAGFKHKVEFLLYQAAQFQEAPGAVDVLRLSLFFHRVSIDTSRRNVSRANPGGQRFQPSLSLTLNFILTPWASKAEDVLWFLGWAMQTLHDNPILDSTLLNASGSVPNIFSPNEQVEVVYDPISLSDLALICDGLKQPSVLPSVSYQVRNIQINP